MTNIIEFLESRIAEDATPAAQVAGALLRLHTFAERDNQLVATGRRELRYHKCVAWDGEDPASHFDTACETLLAIAVPYSDHAGYDQDWALR